MFPSATFIPLFVRFCSELSYCDLFVNGTSFLYHQCWMVILRNTDIVILSGTGAVNKTAQVSAPESTRKREKPSAM